MLLRRCEQLVLRALVEHVVDHLHGVDVAGAHERERRLGRVVVDRHAEAADLALLLERLDRLEPVALLEPVVVPDVELLHVDRVEAEVLEAALRARADVRGGERLVGVRVRSGGPGAVLRRDLRRNVDGLAALADGLPDQPLGVAVAVAEGGVDEVQPEIDRAVQRSQRLVVLRPDPRALADAPGAVADLGDLESCVAELAKVHGGVEYPARARMHPWTARPPSTACSPCRSTSS